jgi:hypothetical protein
VYPRWSIIYVGCCRQLSKCVSVVASQKNSILAFWKWKTLFLWDETENNLRGGPRRPKGHTRVRYDCFGKLCHDQGHDLAHLTYKPCNLKHDNLFCQGTFGKTAVFKFWIFFSQLSHITLKGICPRGNNKVVIILFHVYDKCLFLMLELY